MQTADSYYRSIKRLVDWDEPETLVLVHKLMVEALSRVSEKLPEVAREAVPLTERFLIGAATSRELEEGRIRL